MFYYSSKVLPSSSTHFSLHYTEENLKWSQKVSICIVNIPKEIWINWIKIKIFILMNMFINRKIQIFLLFLSLKVNFLQNKLLLI